MNTNDIAITGVESITAFEFETGDYWFTLDEPQNATILQSEEKTDITGKNGRKLSTLKRDKAITISGSNGLISGGLLEAQTGGKFKTGTGAAVLWSDTLTVEDNAAYTKYKAVGDIGSEIESLNVRNRNGSLGQSFTQKPEADEEGAFSYVAGAKALAFYDGDLADGTEIVVRYKRKIKASVLANNSDNFSKKASLFVDMIGEDKCSNIYKIQIYIPKADFSGEFNLEWSDSQSVHSFEAEALSGSCGIGSSLWTYTVFGIDTKDYETPLPAYDEWLLTDMDEYDIDELDNMILDTNKEENAANAYKIMASLY